VVGRSAIERRFFTALPALAVAWAGLILLAPWLGSAASLPPGATYLSAAVYWLGALVCHQRPARSFHLAGAQLPVCARCTGLYVSGALGAVLAAWRVWPRRAMSFSSWRVVLAWAAAPTVVTIAAEWWQPATSSGLVRAVAAVPLGLAAGALLAEFSGFGGRLLRCETTRRSE
jgi:uncharacterized membrane protein